MCGVIGYIGKKEALPFLIKGLKTLEYRGYDSAGVCVQFNKKLTTIKQKGNVTELEKKIGRGVAEGVIGIAHTRWATHGEPNEINAHPHLDCNENIAIVHNGIVENYRALKNLLEKEGHKIVSETDSEIIAHLIEKFYKIEKNLAAAVLKAVKFIEGAYALLVIGKDGSEIIAAKKSSPLALGIGKEEMFAASDVLAVAGLAKKVVYLDDEEIAVIRRNGYQVKNNKGKTVDKIENTINRQLEQIEKGGFRRFMLKEIFEQPQSFENATKGRIKNGRVKLTVNFNPISVERIIITACGTSWHAGLIGKRVVEKIAGIPVEVDYASEFRYRNPLIKKGDLVLAISQSGETADTLAAIKEAKSKKAETAGIVNAVGSSIAREVDSGIYLHAGPEIGVASTKAFACQTAVLVLLGLYLRQERKSDSRANLSKQETKRILKELEGTNQKIKKVLEKSDEIRKIAEKFKNSRNFLYLGRGINFPVALEGALKLKEISYIHAEGLPAAEMKHGPIALVDKNMPVVFIVSRDGTYEKILSNMEEVKARGGKIIAVASEKDARTTKIADYTISVPETAEELSPIINVIPLQLLAYHIADLKGIDVDKPRNLAKSVTVE